MNERVIYKERLDLALEATGLDLWENNLVSGEVLYHTTKTYTELGYSNEEAASYINNMFAIIHPDDASIVKTTAHEYLTGNAAQYHCEFRLRSKRGAWIWYANYAKSMGCSSNGHRFIGVTFNIDSRKRKEEESDFINRKLNEQNILLENANLELQHSKEILREKEATLIEIQEVAGVGSYVLDIPSATWEGSTVLNDLMGIKNICPRALDEWVDLLHPEDRDAMVNYIQEEVIGQRNAFNKEYRIIRKDNQHCRWVHGRGKLKFNSLGQPIKLIGTIQDITVHYQAKEKIQHLAFNDVLTGLPNRRLLMDRLEHALSSCARTEKSGALLYLDLDNFKSLNDTRGHDVGDLLLKEVALRLISCMRHGDTVARLGGDEFVVILENLSAIEIDAGTQTKKIAQKILVILNQPYPLIGHDYHSTPSIGATLFNGHEQTQAELLKQADIAMYQAKKAGRNTLQFFEPTMQREIASHVKLEADLRRALANQIQIQFQLYYQVQVDASSNIEGAEALIRWRHPERGILLPAEFIPLAEETGLIVPLGNWVLKTACQQLHTWATQTKMAHLTLSVNISAKQFSQPTFLADVLSQVKFFDINPGKLKLEITESMLLDNIKGTIETMNALKAVGIQFSMDDFGTGYSSLQYLKRLPLEQLKIDQSFVRDLVSDHSDQAIVHTIIAMARSLNLNVIAEGVETEAQKQHLINSHCSYFQGYLFSKPIPLASFEVLLEKQASLLKLN
ncbi:MAG: EAL domain-containing protein [Gallionella sp.]